MKKWANVACRNKAFMGPNYKMPMEFLEKDTVLTFCYQSMITQHTTKMGEFHVSNDLV